MNWMHKMQSKQEEKKEIQMKFFLKGETNMHETNTRAQKRTQENFIQSWSAKKSPMLEYIDLGVK